MVGQRVAEENALRPGDEIRIGDRTVFVRGIFSKDTLDQLRFPELERALAEAPELTVEQKQAGRFPGDDLVLACPGFRFTDDADIIGALTGRRRVHVIYHGHYDPIPVVQFVTPDEPEITGIDRTIIDGEWFGPDDVNAVIISDVMARSLGVKAGDTVELEQVKLVVRAILKADEVDKR